MPKKFKSKCPEISYVIDCNYTHDGGARQFNGKGTCMLCEHYERKRNPGSSKEKTEALFRKLFGLTNFIWIPYSTVRDDSDYSDKLKILDGEDKGEQYYPVVFTEGHIDGFAVFGDSNTIVYTVPPIFPESDEVFKENDIKMRENLEILENAKDQDGNPFRLIALPTETTISKKFHPKNKLIYEQSNIDNHLIKACIKENKMLYVPRYCSYINYLMMKGLVVNSKVYKEGIMKKVII